MEHRLLFSSIHICSASFRHFFGAELRETIYHAVWGPGEILHFDFLCECTSAFGWMSLRLFVFVRQEQQSVAATSSSSRGNTSTSVEWEGQLHRSAAQATFLLRLSQLIAINYSSILESEINLQIFQWSYLTQYHLIVWRGGYWFAVAAGQWPPFFLQKAPSLC